MKSFLKTILLTLISLVLLSGIPARASVGTDSLKLSKDNWLYFGWEEDHPKAVSLMGGALYSRRPVLEKHDDHSWEHSKSPWHKDSEKPIFFMVSVDGSAPFYPDETSPSRRTDIEWTLPDGYLPFPTSKWNFGGVTVSVCHVGRRILDNTVDAVYTSVCIRNEDSKSSHTVSLYVCGQSVSERCFALKKCNISTASGDMVTEPVKLKSGKSVSFEFVSPANGTCSVDQLRAQGDFQSAFSSEKARIETKMAGLTMPVTLPDDRYVDLWKASMCHMWNATVKTPVDYEQRGSGGNVFGFYQYDRVFDHDVPDMVIEYILEGNWEVARQIMDGATYKYLGSGTLTKEQYLDAIPKFLITMAQYLITTGDKAYFDGERIKSIITCAHAVQNMREFTEETKAFGVYGLIYKGHTLDNNKKTYTIVDDFAALHGFASYVYLCSELNLPDEKSWAETQMKDLNDCLNAALRKSFMEGEINWYNACFSFDMDYNLVAGPGNWLGTTFMMPTFPWNAQLKGFDLKGEWFDALDASVEKWQEIIRFYGSPKGSLGAWWGAKFGAAYNAGMAMQLLASEKYRTMIPESIDWLLDQQTAPMIWGESFHKAKYEGDWTRPEVDLETWGLGFIRQAILQMCVSVKSDSDVIIGRGMPDSWIESGKPVKWERVHIAGGKTISLSIRKSGDSIGVIIDGDANDGNYIIDIPYCRGRIADVAVEGGSVISKDYEHGKVTVSGGAGNISIKLVTK